MTLLLSGVQYCPCNRIALMLTRVAQYEKLSIHNIKVQAMQDVLWSSISSGRVLSGPLGLKSLMRKTIHENMMGLLICIYLVYKNHMRIFMAIKEFYTRSLGIPESLISMQIDEWIEWNFTSRVGLKLPTQKLDYHSRLNCIYFFLSSEHKDFFYL